MKSLSNVLLFTESEGKGILDCSKKKKSSVKSFILGKNKHQTADLYLRTKAANVVRAVIAHFCESLSKIGHSRHCSERTAYFD